MSQIVIGVVIAVISAIIISIFRIGGNQKVMVHVQGNPRAGTLWKLLIVLGWVMFVGGIYYGLAWASTNGWNDPRQAMGLSSAVLTLMTRTQHPTLPAMSYDLWRGYFYIPYEIGFISTPLSRYSMYSFFASSGARGFE